VEGFTRGHEVLAGVSKKRAARGCSLPTNCYVGSFVRNGHQKARPGSK